MFNFLLGNLYFWDYLRPITEFAKQIDLPVKLAVFVLAVFIFFISVMSYRRSGSRRILIISFAFLLFSLKLLVKIVDYFYSPGNFLSDSSENIFELGILLALFVALFYGRKGKKFFAQET